LKTTLSLTELKEFATAPTLMELNRNFVEDVYVSEPTVEVMVYETDVRKSSKTNASKMVLDASAV